MKHFVILLVALVMATYACGGAGAPLVADEVALGQVYLAQPGTTLYWVNQAFSGATNTWILAKDGGYIVMWAMPGQQGMGFTMIKEASATGTAATLNWMEATGGKGNIANYQDVTKFIEYMKTQGWKPASTAMVSESLKIAFKQAWEMTKLAGIETTQSLLSMGQNLISIFVVPVAALPLFCAPEIPANLCTFEPVYY